MLRTIADKFNFKFEFKVAAGFVDAINMASKQRGVTGFNAAKWKKTKQQLSKLPGLVVPGSCLVSFCNQS